jgi:hypothetical protein
LIKMKKIILILISLYNFSFAYNYSSASDFAQDMDNLICTVGTSTGSSRSYTYSYCDENKSITTYSSGSSGYTYGTDIYSYVDSVCTLKTTSINYYNCYTASSAEKENGETGICQGQGIITIGSDTYQCSDIDNELTLLPPVENGGYNPDGSIFCNSGFIENSGSCSAVPENSSGFDENGDLICNTPYVSTGTSCNLPPNTNPDGSCSEGSYKDLLTNTCLPVTDTGDTGTGTGTGTGDNTDTGDTGTGTGTGTGDNTDTGTGTGTGTGDNTDTGDTGTGTGTDGGGSVGGTDTGTGTGTGTGDNTDTGDTGTGTGTGDNTDTGDTSIDLSEVLNALSKLESTNKSSLEANNQELKDINQNLLSIRSFNSETKSGLESVVIGSIEDYTNLDGVSLTDNFSNTLNDVASKYLGIFSGYSNTGTKPLNIDFEVFGNKYTLIDFSVFDDYVSYIRNLFLFLAYMGAFFYFLRGAR